MFDAAKLLILGFGADCLPSEQQMTNAEPKESTTISSPKRISSPKIIVLPIKTIRNSSVLKMEAALNAKNQQAHLSQLIQVLELGSAPSESPNDRVAEFRPLT